MNRREFLKSMAIGAASIYLPSKALNYLVPKTPSSIHIPAALHKGDIFTIAGVYAKNTKNLQHFVYINEVSGKLIQHPIT